MKAIFACADCLLKGTRCNLITLRAINTKIKNKIFLSYTPETATPGQILYDDISSIYEKFVTVNTFGQHSRWRRSFVKHLAPFENMKILDAAAGTGLTTREILNQTAKTQSKSNFSICLCDFSSGMMQIGVNKIEQQGLRELVNFVETDIHDLPFQNDTFDLAVFTFSFRTGVDIDQAFKELVRVVKPGGRVGVLDFSYSKSPTAVQRLYNLFLDHIFSRIANLVWKKADVAYYIAENIRKCPSKDEVVAKLTKAGFHQISTKSYMGEIAYHYIGYKINKNK